MALKDASDKASDTSATNLASKRRGPKAAVFNRVVAAMMSDIRGGVLPAKELEDEKEVALAARYGAGRTTVQKARMKVLSEFRGGNSDN